jgi:hypothetical protein
MTSSRAVQNQGVSDTAGVRRRAETSVARVRDQLDSSALASGVSTVEATGRDVQLALNSPGRSLDVATQELLQPMFGRDFSSVRVHTDSFAVNAAGQLRASAFTVGQSIVFGNSAYAPHSPNGFQLLAHELVHTLQQRDAAPVDSLSVGPTDDAFEAQAFEYSSMRSGGRTVSDMPIGRAPMSIQCAPADGGAETAAIEESAEVPMPAWLDEAIALLTAHAGDAGEVGIGLIPGLGDIYDIVTVLVGRTLITNEELDDIDRLITLGGLLPIPFVTGRILRAGRGAVEFVIKRLGINPKALVAKVVKEGMATIEQIWMKVESAFPPAPKSAPLREAGSVTKASQSGTSKVVDIQAGRKVSPPQATPKPPEFGQASTARKLSPMPDQDAANLASKSDSADVIDIKTRRKLFPSEVASRPSNQAPDLGPVSTAQKKTHAKTRRRFRKTVNEILEANPSHPLKKIWGRHMHAGRVAHQKSGARELVGVELGSRNVRKVTEKQGIGLVNRYVDVEGIPVEEFTAKQLVKEGKLKQEHIGKYVDGWSLEGIELVE